MNTDFILFQSVYTFWGDALYILRERLRFIIRTESCSYKAQKSQVLSICGLQAGEQGKLVLY